MGLEKLESSSDALDPPKVELVMAFRMGLSSER